MTDVSRAPIEPELQHAFREAIAQCRDWTGYAAEPRVWLPDRKQDFSISEIARLITALPDPVPLPESIEDELLRLMHLDTRGALEGYLREKTFQSAGKALLAVIKIKGKD
jgi:hypothetical protein